MVHKTAVRGRIDMLTPRRGRRPGPGARSCRPRLEALRRPPGAGRRPHRGGDPRRRPVLRPAVGPPGGRRRGQRLRAGRHVQQRGGLGLGRQDRRGHGQGHDPRHVPHGRQPGPRPLDRRRRQPLRDGPRERLPERGRVRAGRRVDLAQDPGDLRRHHGGRPLGPPPRRRDALRHDLLRRPRPGRRLGKLGDGLQPPRRRRHAAGAGHVRREHCLEAQRRPDPQRRHPLRHDERLHPQHDLRGAPRLGRRTGPDPRDVPEQRQLQQGQRWRPGREQRLPLRDRLLRQLSRRHGLQDADRRGPDQHGGGHGRPVPRRRADRGGAAARRHGHRRRRDRSRRHLLGEPDDAHDHADPGGLVQRRQRRRPRREPLRRQRRQRLRGRPGRWLGDEPPGPGLQGDRPADPEAYLVLARPRRGDAGQAAAHGPGAARRPLAGRLDHADARPGLPGRGVVLRRRAPLSRWSAASRPSPA